ncbi:MAG: chromosome segregation protein SMC [Planctomycetes bacterium]|nr:chromosome segregation protein SMC [Planctomycetota bacterium]
MQLRKLELAGFKSFHDRTEFVFDGGITAVVGPNGCGKSNLVDAVRWVLGEQSAKSLRAGSMGDCIFAGTSSRKALGCAEVTLTFDNSDSTLPIDYDQVAVTRRVYGSGESEYLINRKPCRLREIRELFMGTGVGTASYFIIEQGQVGRIISSDPKELRAVFDEAAGISLYKARLRTAAAKLERVNQNLLRVGDILSEVEKRLRSVKYQAAKARRHKNLSERLRGLKLLRARKDYATLSARRDDLSGRIEAAHRETDRLQAAMAGLESQSEAATSHLVGIEEQIERFSADSRKFDKEVDKITFDIELSRERIDHHKENRARLLGAVDEGRLELETAETLAVGLETRKASIEKRAGRLSGLAEALSRDEREHSLKADSLSGEITSAQIQAIEALRASAGLNNRLSEIAAAEHAALRQKERLERRRVELGDLCTTLGGKRSALLLEDQSLHIRRERLRKQIAGTGERKKAYAALREDLRRAASEVSGALAAIVSRRELLVDLVRRREGVSAAAGAVLDMNLPGTLGLVADLIDVPAHLRAPVESLLQETAGAVVVESTETALGAAGRLKEAGTGRARIVSLERARAAGAPGTPTDEQGLVPIAREISCREDCTGLAAALLGDCRLAESIEAALSANGSALHLRIATPEGDVVDRNGSFHAGAAGEAGGLIWRRAEIERLSKVEKGLRSEVSAFEDRRREVLLDIGALDEHETALENALSRNRARAAELQAAVEALDSRLAESAREMEIAAGETASLEEEISASAHEREAVRARIDQVRREGSLVEEKTVRLKGERTETVRQLEEIRVRYSRLKVTLASVIQKQSALERRCREARASLERRADMLSTATKEIAAAEGLVAEENHRILQADERLQAARRQASSARIVLAARSREGRRLRDESSRLAPSLKKARAALEAAQAQLLDLSIEEREVSVRLDDVVSRARDELDISPSQLGEPAGEIEDEAELESEIQDISRKLSSVGPVNMEALAELDELESRHAFLSGQRDDLAAARESLEKVIAKTRATSRKMFLESFEAIREQFSTIFRRIFGGGRADCLLEDPSDALESRVSIMAKPPEKELSQLSLLSGGEKAMTAVALLFAMFSTRPSPFLILDEVDAPMDESNIGRFIDLVRDFLDASQFVIITHSRRTMAAADRIYGITMEERGVSKKVSVSFRSEPRALEPVPV